MSQLHTVSDVLPALPPVEIIFGRSAAMGEIRRKLERIGATEVPVLLCGESGTGKDLLARYLHHQSRAAEGPFVKVNCAAIPFTLLESELFGYERGAFTGATTSKPGRIEQAEGGTLFLDEIGELELGLQSKLLQLLQDRRFLRLGGGREIVAHTRLLFATNRHLPAEVAEGRFRQDLYYRINVVGIAVPPLRERGDDIVMLAQYFLEAFCRRFDRDATLPGELLQAFRDYSWPGNVRELENLVKRYVVLGSVSDILQELRASASASNNSVVPMPGADGAIALKSVTRRAVREFEREIILHTLEAHHWNRKSTARALRISYRALLYKLKDAGLQARSPAATAPGAVAGDNPAESGAHHPIGEQPWRKNEAV
jgi:two-component system response regulator AtoC